MSDRRTRAGQSFDAFWLAYLQEHASPTTRAFHFFGTTVGVLGAAGGMITLDPLLPLAGIGMGYGCAWLSHFVIERNMPAMRSHPIRAFLCDLRMTLLWYAGRLGPELARAGVRLQRPISGPAAG